MLGHMERTSNLLGVVVTDVTSLTKPSSFCCFHTHGFLVMLGSPVLWVPPPWQYHRVIPLGPCYLLEQPPLSGLAAYTILPAGGIAFSYHPLGCVFLLPSVLAYYLPRNKSTLILIVY